MRRTNVFVALLCLTLVSAAWAQVVPTRTVTGTRIGHYKDGAVPVDLSVRTVAAFVPGVAGGYSVIAGSGTTAGTFTIPNVPYGYYLLQLGTRYLWTKNTVVNGDFNAAYRSTRASAGANTTLTFNLSNLNSWQDSDLLEMVDPSTAAFDLYPGTDGATTFTGTFPYTDLLNDSTLGDKTYFLQLATQQVGGYPFLSVARFLAPTFTQVDGSDTTVTGALRPVNQTQSFVANINGADLAAQTLAANSAAALTLTAVALDVYPGNLAKGATTSTPDLVSYDLNGTMPPLTVNANLGEVMYGNPFPPSFGAFVVYFYQAQTSYLLAGTTTPAPVTTNVYGYTPAIPTSTSPVSPMVGVVSNPSVGGGSFFTDRSGIGYMPTLSWAPPQVGTAHVYVVTVYWLIHDAGSTVATLIGRLQTQGTSLTLPPGLLSPGQTYVFTITAEYTPGVNLVKNPFVLGTSHAYAEVTSGMMQP